MVDVAKLHAEVAKMSAEDANAKLLKIRTQQVTQQLKARKRPQSSDYGKKQRELFKLLKARAIESGTYDTINTEAKTVAREKVGA